MKKKLIEVALPLDAINAASRKEKSIFFGHPTALLLSPDAECSVVYATGSSSIARAVLSPMQVRMAAESMMPRTRCGDGTIRPCRRYRSTSSG